MKVIEGTIIQDDETLWRYFKTSRFIEIIETGEIYFAAANQFDDQFEGAVGVHSPPPPIGSKYPKYDYLDKSFRELTRLTKISCWHLASYESNAMWQLYADQKKGVAITTTTKRMSNAFEPFRLSPTYSVEDLWGGKIDYVDLTQERLNLSMLNRFFVKHLAFEWEREFRLLISLRMAEEFGVAVPAEGIRVQVDPATLIDRIILGPTISSDDRERISDAASKMGLGNKIELSSLLGKPRYL